MIIGNGQLAKAFAHSDIGHEDLCIFASGVSNSSCTDPKEFAREKQLLLNTLSANQDKKIIYFSSCALSVPAYSKNDYYCHKKDMEDLIKSSSDKFYIFRLPQLFGELFLHKTLINYIYKCIEHNHNFKVYDNAYRYVIEINDVRKLVEAYLNFHEAGVTVDLANPYRYQVLDIVHAFEILLDKKARYDLVEKDDQYLLDLSPMVNFVNAQNLQLEFGPDYLIKKLSQKLKQS